MMIVVVIIMIFASVFLTVLALFFGILAARQSPVAVLKRRLKHIAAGSDIGQSEAFTSELLREATTPSESIFVSLPLMGTVTRWIEHSGVHISSLRFGLFSGMAAIMSFIVVIVLSGYWLAALLAMLLFGGIPLFYLGYRKHQRLTRFDEQFPDALTMISRSLRAGHSLSGAIELVSQEMPEPTGGLFKIAFEQQQLGLRMTESLRSLRDKIESVDFNFFVTIIRINSETGGNLAEILDKLADTTRSRLQIRRQVRVYSAQGRLSGYILTALPVVVFVAFQFLNPDYMKVFFTERICQLALLGALLLQFFGFLMIRKIVDIRI